VRVSADEAVVGAPNVFAMQTIERSYLPVISETLAAVLKRAVRLSLEVCESQPGDEYTPSIASITIIPPPESLDSKFARDLGYGLSPSQLTPAQVVAAADLNPKYTFASFVVGSHNRFSHSAALAVAANPGQAYNPLFIYGGVGLGKTHLLQAIGNQIMMTSPGRTVRYMSGEKFTNELILCLKDNRMADFRKRYRQVDVLLMDDIQFIEGKESTQEEFFHTFNAIRESGRQVVLSSDRPPHALSRLEERLRSRFAAGLIADVQPADYETRVAILQKKCEAQNIAVPDDVLEYIASNFVGNIRELEGALIRATAYASLTGAPLTKAGVRSMLHPGGAPPSKPVLTVEKIIEAVAAAYQLEPSEIKSTKRSQHLALPRHIAMYLCNHIMQMSFPRIGSAFGNRKHTSAIYAVDRIKAMIVENPEVADSVKKISRQLGV
jgi:chromosomal replication initiator protein